MRNHFQSQSTATAIAIQHILKTSIKPYFENQLKNKNKRLNQKIKKKVNEPNQIKVTASPFDLIKPPNPTRCQLGYKLAIQQLMQSMVQPNFRYGQVLGETEAKRHESISADYSKYKMICSKLVRKIADKFQSKQSGQELWPNVDFESVIKRYCAKCFIKDQQSFEYRLQDHIGRRHSFQKGIRSVKLMSQSDLTSMKIMFDMKMLSLLSRIDRDSDQKSQKSQILQFIALSRITHYPPLQKVPKQIKYKQLTTFILTSIKDQLNLNYPLKKFHRSSMNRFLLKAQQKFISSQVSGRQMYHIQERIREVSKKTFSNWIYHELRRSVKNIIKYKSKSQQDSHLSFQEEINSYRYPVPSKVRQKTNPSSNIIKIQRLRRKPQNDPPHRMHQQQPMQAYKQPTMYPHQDKPIKRIQHRKKSNLNLFQQKKQEFQQMVESMSKNSINLEQYAYSNHQSKYSKRNKAPVIRYKNLPTDESSLPTSFPNNLQVTSTDYPIRLFNLCIQSPSESYIEYKINGLNLKQLSVRFLTDRRKFVCNKVRLLGNGLKMRKRDCEQKVKMIKAIRILNCLGAQIELGQQKPYETEHITKGQSIVMLTSFLLGEEVKTIYNLYAKNRQNI